jgi:outer membrane protein
LLAQWHFTDFGPFKPYIGLGVNYTIFFGQSAGYTPTNGLGVTNLTLHNTVGGALQVGFDYMIDKHWGLNFDVKKYLLRPTYNATVNNTIPGDRNGGHRSLDHRRRRNLPVLGPANEGPTEIL